MASMQAQRDVVFIFGAGASQDVGLPTMSGFHGEVEKVAKDPDLPDGVREDFERVRHWFGNPQAARTEWFDPLNMEHLFCLWQMEKETGSPGASDKLDSLISVISCVYERSLVWRNPSAPPSPWVADDTGYVGLLRRLFKRYADHWSDAISSSECLPFSFVTTNYDLALEDALLSESHYGPHGPQIRRTYNKHWFDDNLGILDLTDEEEGILNESVSGTGAWLPIGNYGLIGREWNWSRAFPRLLKLHGSINWGICPECGNVQVFRYPLPDRRGQSIGPRVLQDLTSTPCGWHPETQHAPSTPSRAFTYQPLIVPPTWSKSGQCATLRDVWRQAIDELRRAKRVVFVGYSLPETDVHIRYLLVTALAGNNAMPPTMVVNRTGTDRNGRNERKRIEGHYRALGMNFRKKNTYRYENKRFGDALDDIEDFLDSRANVSK